MHLGEMVDPASLVFKLLQGGPIWIITDGHFLAVITRHEHKRDRFREVSLEIEVFVNQFANTFLISYDPDNITILKYFRSGWIDFVTFFIFYTHNESSSSFAHFRIQ